MLKKRCTQSNRRETSSNKTELFHNQRPIKKKKPKKTNIARFHISPYGLSNPTQNPNDVHALLEPRNLIDKNKLIHESESIQD